MRKVSMISLMALAVQMVAGMEPDNVPSVLENGAIVRRNGIYYNNRPLYAGQDNPDQRYYWVFAGDKPLLRYGGGAKMDGCFMLGFQRADGQAKWLMDFKSVEARYRSGQMEWVASDPEFPGMTLSLQALPLGTGFGMAAQAKVSSAASGDRLVWMLGAAHSQWVSFIDAMAADSQHVRYEGFDPAKAEGNGVEVTNGVIRMVQGHGYQGRHTLAACSAASELRIVDADQWKTPTMLMASTGGNRPVACGATPIVNDQPITWIAKVFQGNDALKTVDVTAEFNAAEARVARLANRVVSKTPDVRFDFMVRAAASAADGLWREKAYGHGCLSAFVNPLLGWRSTLAGVAYGWHERVLTAGQTFLASQVKTEDYRGEPALAKIVDNEELARYEGSLCHPGKDPRFHSKGRLIPNQNSTMYDMQSQFVDALVEDWRFTADPEMEKLLRPALELHLDYLARVFDPDGDGTYESFSNTFLTDSVWTNGGSTPEETAFAFRGHLAARDMARRAGDKATEKRHEAKLALIRKGFFGQLWVASRGIPGAYREQGGHKRLHDDPWTPGLYLPMDCPGLLTDEQMASMCYFTEYGLQREPRPTGGVRLYPSNWVPTIWSNRHKSPGDEYHMALGYCFAGMPEGALELINGNISESAFESAVPGNLGVPYASCGTDFGDCVGAFARTVVSGVFGYRPDYPNGKVLVTPQFPAEWTFASFNHPEYTLDYRRDGATENLTVEVTREAELELEVPFRGMGITSVMLNGRKVMATVRPGFGRSLCVVRTPVTKKAVVTFTVEQPLPQAKPQFSETAVGETVEVAVAGGKVLSVNDPQGVFKASKISGNKVSAHMGDNLGHNRVLFKVAFGDAPQWRIFDFNVRAPKDEAYAAEKNLRQAPPGASWSAVDMAGHWNGSVADIFRQDYVSPRPDTCSLRLARDGYLIWNALYAGKTAPAIDLSLTRPERVMPIYEAAGDGLKLGPQITIEAWLSADIADMGDWSVMRVFDLGDFTMEIMARCGRLLRMSVNTPIIYVSSPLSGARLTHVAVVYDTPGKPGKLYLDGKLCIERPYPVDWEKLPLKTLRLGGYNAWDKGRFMGHIARLSIASKPATGEQLKKRTVDAPPLDGAIADWRIPEACPEQLESAVAGAPTLVRKDEAFARPKGMPPAVPVVDGMLRVPQGAQFKWNIGKKNIAFTSLWDNWPAKITVPVNKKGDSVWLLVAGSTNPMQVRIANAVLRFEYADGQVETLELVNPMNFWSLCPFLWADYDYAVEGFSLPQKPPSQVQLGSNCRAMVYGWKLRPGVELKQVTLEALSQEVVIGLMGLSVCE